MAEHHIIADTIEAEGKRAERIYQHLNALAPALPSAPQEELMKAVNDLRSLSDALEKAAHNLRDGKCL